MEFVWKEEEFVFVTPFWGRYSKTIINTSNYGKKEQKYAVQFQFTLVDDKPPPSPGLGVTQD